jgi:hypothetical protein
VTSSTFAASVASRSRLKGVQKTTNAMSDRRLNSSWNVLVTTATRPPEDPRTTDLRSIPTRTRTLSAAAGVGWIGSLASVMPSPCACELVTGVEAGSDVDGGRCGQGSVRRAGSRRPTAGGSSRRIGSAALIKSMRERESAWLGKIRVHPRSVARLHERMRAEPCRSFTIRAVWMWRANQTISWSRTSRRTSPPTTRSRSASTRESKPWRWPTRTESRTARLCGNQIAALFTPTLMGR